MWDVAPSTAELLKATGHRPSSEYPKTLSLRCIFTLEWDLAHDIATGLFRLRYDGRLPKPRVGNPDLQVIHDERTAETTFFIPGDTNGDPHDQFVFSVTIDLQTATDLYDKMNIGEWFS
jgi:hypothetical protein